MRPLHLLLAATLLSLPACTRAQSSDPRAAPGVPAAPTEDGAMEHRAVNDAMSGDLVRTAHMAMTPMRVPTHDDSVRADAILRQLEQGIAPYRDWRVAIGEGYKPFLPNVPQKIYHFTSTRRAIASAFRFDPAAPTSLLYAKTSGGGWRLVGAMYTAPRRASLEQLDERVPLGVGQWHEHTDICIPPRGQLARWREKDASGKPLFGPAGSITTKAACDAAGGRFFAQIFGWMLHVNPWASDPHDVWGTHDEHGHDQGMAHDMGHDSTHRLDMDMGHAGADSSTERR